MTGKGKTPIDSYSESEKVVVKFEDGINAVFVPYSHGIGYQIEGLRNFFLVKNGQTLCEVNSRLYRCGPLDDEHKVKTLSPEITLKDVTEYWEKAKDFVTGRFYPKGKSGENYKITDDKFWYQWRVVTEGYFDLQRLKEGKMEILTKKE